MPRLELICRALLITHSVCSLSGYISFIQTDYQLVSPLIPSSTVFQIAKQSIFASFLPTVLLIPSLLFYFFQKRMIVIITSTTALVYYFLVSNNHIII